MTTRVTPRRSCGGFLFDRGGNIALLAALLAPLLLIVGGGALDFASQTSARRAVQEAADAGALAAAFAFVHNEDIETKAGQAAHRAFQSNINLDQLEKGYKRRLRRTGNEFEYSIDAAIKARFLHLAGMPTLSVSARSTAIAPSALGAEYAIIIDTTNSMGFGDTWEVAMDALADTLDHLRLHADPNHFYVTLVPYADRVRVDEDKWIKGAAPSNWNGCVEPREEVHPGFPYALSDRKPNGDKFTASVPGVTGGLASLGAPYPNCPNVAITGPTSDTDEIAEAASRFSKSGTGRLDVGLAWGWRALTHDWSGVWKIPGYPALPKKARKTAIFITDGHTTAYKHEMSKTEDFGWNNGSREGFEHLVHVCDQMKDDEIEIYVFRTNGNPHSETYFKDCASSPLHYRTITSNEDLKDAFATLIDEDGLIRLTK